MKFARNVSYTPYPTGDKHTLSTLLIKPIFSVLAEAEKQFFSKLVFECFSYSQKRLSGETDRPKTGISYQAKDNRVVEFLLSEHEQ